MASLVNNELPPQFCRVCACEIQGSSHKIENNLTKPQLPLLLRRYVPELDVKVSDACLCRSCVSTLYRFHNFKRVGLRMEGDLRLYMRKHPEKKAINLNEFFAREKQENTNTNTTKKVPKKPFFCKLCDRTFSAKHLLAIHTRTYHRRKRFDCDKCNRHFALKSQYEEHLEYHKRKNSDRHMCKICNFVYQTSSGLHKHNLSKHTSEDQRPFVCTVCGKGFVEGHSLELHTRIHTGEKPFKCSQCSYASGNKRLLMAHIRSKHS